MSRCTTNHPSGGSGNGREDSSPPERADGAGGPVLEQVVKAKLRAETDVILAALNSTRWNRKRAAAMLKIDYKALLYKMKKLGIESGFGNGSGGTLQ